LLAYVSNNATHWPKRLGKTLSCQALLKSEEIMKQKIISVIMGGGRGTRLYPLTKLRCKPAVPLGGKHRLVDIPISNCLNSDVNQIYLLSQFNTASLHHHIQSAYKFDSFGGGFVDIFQQSKRRREETGIRERLMP
jgi:ADP-glucose pyrophosphorylase